MVQYFVPYYFSNKLQYFSYDYTVNNNRLSVIIYFFNYFSKNFFIMYCTVHIIFSITMISGF